MKKRKLIYYKDAVFVNDGMEMKRAGEQPQQVLDVSNLSDEDFIRLKNKPRDKKFIDKLRKKRYVRVISESG